MATTSETLDLCRTLIRTPSSSRHSGEAEIVALIRSLLIQFGATDLGILSGQAEHPNLICSVDSGKDGPNLIVACHVDVFDSDPTAWSIDPLEPEVKDGEIWGAGASDAKGGLAAMLIAAGRFIRQSRLQAGKLTLVFSADEDASGRWGIPWLAGNGHIKGDAAIVLTPAGFVSDYDGLPIAARGFVNLKISISAPGGGYTWGYSPERPHAVAAAARLITAIEQHFRPDPAIHPLFPDGPTVVAGCPFQGGEKPGFLAETAEFSLESRILPGTTLDSFCSQLRDFITEYSRTVDVDIELEDTWLGGYADGCELPTNHPLAVAALKSIKANGYPDIAFAGSPLFCEGAVITSLGYSDASCAWSGTRFDGPPG